MNCFSFRIDWGVFRLSLTNGSRWILFLPEITFVVCGSPFRLVGPFGIKRRELASGKATADCPSSSPIFYPLLPSKSQDIGPFPACSVYRPELPNIVSPLLLSSLVLTIPPLQYVFSCSHLHRSSTPFYRQKMPSRKKSSVSPMLAHEADLPALPIPTISSTAEKYLESTRPHLTPAEFRTTQLAVNDFLSSSLVKRLQTRLEERAMKEQNEGRNNWLSEWWNDVAYMAYRDPVVVFVSYFYVHMAGNEGIGRSQRAAELVKSMLLFRQLVESEQLEPEKVKGTPLAMSSYRWL